MESSFSGMQSAPWELVRNADSSGPPGPTESQSALDKLPGDCLALPKAISAVSSLLTDPAFSVSAPFCLPCPFVAMCLYTEF